MPTEEHRAADAARELADPAAARGSAAAVETLSEIYRRYAPVVHRRSLAMLGDPDEALDTVQDVFLVLQRELPRFRGDSSLLTWIYRITTNHCLNRLRSRRIRRGVLTLLARDRAGSVDQASSQIVERRELLGLLLGALDERRVQIAVHYYYDEMTQPEIARLLGISDRAVRKALRRIEEQARTAGARLELLHAEAP